MGMIFLKTLVYSSKYAKDKSCAGGAAVHVAVRDTSVEKHRPTHAHAASHARTHDTNTKRNRNKFPDSYSLISDICIYSLGSMFVCACERAGEAKLRGCVRRVSSQRWCL